MKLALIAPAPIPANTANSIQIMKMAQAFVRLGHELRVYAGGRNPGINWGEMARHYGLNERIEIEWLPRTPFFRGYDYAWRAVGAARGWGAEWIYTRLPQAAALASRQGVPTLFEVHDLPAGRMGPRLLRAFLGGAGAKRLVVITRALGDALARQYAMPEKEGFLQVAPDGVDLERYADLPSPEGARAALDLPQGFTAGYTGHLYEGRGVELLLELAERLPGMHFLLVGGQAEAVDALRKQAAERGIQNLRLTGFVPNAELPQYQAACDALLMPYQARVAASSGGDIAPFLSPMKMFEYLACGRPILASDLPVLAEVLNAENALSLPAEDVDAWTDALRRVREDRELAKRLAEGARMAARGYSWEKRAERILAGLV